MSAKFKEETKWAVPGLPVFGAPRSESTSRIRGTTDSFLRTLKRHSLRIRRSRSLAVTEKRKSGKKKTYEHFRTFVIAEKVFKVYLRVYLSF
jgi:hypothetical protein